MSRTTILICIGTLTAACRPQHNPLEPAPVEHPAAAPGDAVQTMVEGVEVIASADAWPGRPSILDDVTPLRLTLRNDSERPLRVHLEQLRLVDQQGRSYAALPLYLIDGEAHVVEHLYDPHPSIHYDGYYVADPYRPYYVGMDPWHYDYDYGYYDYAGYYGYWHTIDLPTQRMVDLAIPEGVVGPGGHVTGFVYFERVSPVSQAVDFQYDLVDADTGERIGRADLTFDVLP